VGDPLNAVRIFNEKEVDEIIVLDIDASAQHREPNYELIRSLAAECRMPLCYGGGIKTVEQFQQLVSLGVEKVAISSAAVEHPDLVSEAAYKVGSHSVVVVMDVKETGSPGDFRLLTHNATKTTNHSPAEFATQMEQLGAGEVVVNSVDCDGVMKGYPFDLVSAVRNATSLPMTVLGGAGSLNDIEKLIASYGIIGAAAGSLFVFKGIYRAVLINYPKRAEKDALFQQVFA